MNVLENARAADITVEDQRFDRIRVPESVGVERIEGMERRHPGFPVARCQQALVIIRRHRPRVEVALHVKTADGKQVIGLRLGLDALGDHGHAEPFRHADDRFEDVAAARGIARAGKKAHIELEDVRRHVLERVERGIPAPEIIDFDGEAVPGQALDNLNDLVGRLREGGLGDFEPKERERHVVLLNQPRDDLEKALAEDIVARNIDRYGQRLQPLVQPRAQARARLLPDILVHLVDEAVALEHRDELRRRNQALRGMPPPHQRLGADQRARGMVVLRLIPDLKLSRPDRRVHIVDDFLLAQDARAHRLAVQRDGRIKTRLDGRLRDRRAVVHRAARQLRIIHDVAPDAVRNGIDRPVKLGRAQTDIGDKIAVHVSDGIQHGEVIRHDAPAYAAQRLETLPKDARRHFEHVVALGAAVTIVDDLEIIQIKARHHIVSRFPRGDHFLRLGEKRLAVVQPREPVPLNGVHKLRRFAQADGVAEAVADDRRLVRLGDKVVRAQRQRARLRRLRRRARRDDHGDLRQLFVGCDDLERLIAVHHRHHQIQQHGGNRFALGAHDIDRLPAVFRLDDVVLGVQHTGEDHAIDSIIVDNQDFSWHIIRLRTEKCAFLHNSYTLVVRYGMIIQ